MQIPLHIVYEGGLEPSPALQARIEREAAKLESFSDRITACRVVLIGRSHNRRQGDLFDVRIHVTMPGNDDIIVDRNPDLDHAHEDAFVAIRDAFRAATRRLQDHERRFEGSVKHHEAPPHGRVAKIFPEEGYGFIVTPDGREIYFHRNAVANEAFGRLRKGSEVRFTEVEGDKGPQASIVHRLGKSHVVEPL